MLIQPGALFNKASIICIGLRYPAISIPEHTHEPWPSAINFCKAYRQNFATFGLIGCNAPTQINIDQFDEAFPQPRP
ncbi:hypothetical protein AQZ52_02075 [Novosphingobium fuchskuhlense]|uniref:Uncharacterized protein n=1 Tax=Novosphingobium fuchskuhlense TaxID=1117702 RepID=A0A117UWG7_9SPHN|nr:hypothetical protein AQZ52_02075 [Novosphingobium fuchskuhlense]